MKNIFVVDIHNTLRIYFKVFLHGTSIIYLIFTDSEEFFKFMSSKLV